MFEWMTTYSGWIAFATLSAIEIILGIDNVIFISLLVSRLPREQAQRARAIGLLLALGMRVALLFALTAIIALKEPFTTIFGQPVSWRDVILFVGGAFLIFKAVHEIHETIEGDGELVAKEGRSRAFMTAMVQIAVIDLVFSIDSIITAIGMAQDIGVMIAAVLMAMAVMYVASAPLSAFITRHPTTKILALAFLLLIGVALCADAFAFHIPRSSIYAAMAFAALIETLNLLTQKKRKVQRAKRLSRKNQESSATPASTVSAKETAPDA